ncbi:hypothetical protein BC827DRAFT_1153901 [Russula dissimulans]|nr:hypothetical protein BC827DRAFT_1153901 [Russula dissimulans]
MKDTAFQYRDPRARKGHRKVLIRSDPIRVQVIHEGPPTKTDGMSYSHLPSISMLLSDSFSHVPIIFETGTPVVSTEHRLSFIHRYRSQTATFLYLDSGNLAFSASHTFLRTNPSPLAHTPALSSNSTVVVYYYNVLWFLIRTSLLHLNAECPVSKTMTECRTGLNPSTKATCYAARHFFPADHRYCQVNPRPCTRPAAQARGCCSLGKNSGLPRSVSKATAGKTRSLAASHGGIQEQLEVSREGVLVFVDIEVPTEDKEEVSSVAAETNVHSSRDGVGQYFERSIHARPDEVSGGVGQYSVFICSAQSRLFSSTTNQTWMCLTSERKPPPWTQNINGSQNALELQPQRYANTVLGFLETSLPEPISRT